MKRLISISLLISIILCGCQTSEISVDINDPLMDETKTIQADMTDTVWNSLNTENSRFQNREEFISEAENCMKEISKFLDRENWIDVYQEKHGADYICSIDYRLTSGASHVENGYQAYLSLIPKVYLNRDLFEHDLAPIAHETTHIIAPFYSSLSLREGLASYCQDKFGNNPTVFNWGLEAHAYSKLYLMHEKEEFDKLFPVIGTADALQNVYAQGDSRAIFYNLSHSFAKYLIDCFGIDKFMKLYESDDLIAEYTVVCEKSFESIKEDWYKSLELYPETLTMEDVQKSILDLFTKHKYSMN